MSSVRWSRGEQRRSRAAGSYFIAARRGCYTRPVRTAAFLGARSLARAGWLHSAAFFQFVFFYSSFCGEAARCRVDGGSANEEPVDGRWRCTARRSHLSQVHGAEYVLDSREAPGGANAKPIWRRRCRENRHAQLVKILNPSITRPLAPSLNDKITHTNPRSPNELLICRREAVARALYYTVAAAINKEGTSVSSLI